MVNNTPVQKANLLATFIERLEGSEKQLAWAKQVVQEYEQSLTRLLKDNWQLPTDCSFYITHRDRLIEAIKETVVR